MMHLDRCAYGVAGLRIADAAIMPTVISGDANTTTVQGSGPPIRFASICGSQHDLSRRERCAKRLPAIVNPQGGKPDDRNN